MLTDDDIQYSVIHNFENEYSYVYSNSISAKCALQIYDHHLQL